MQAMRLSLALCLCSGILSLSTAFAHSGGLDSNGGHFNRRTGEYHYHGGGGGGSSSGFDSLSSLYSTTYQPAARVRARTRARMTSRTEANSMGRSRSLSGTKMTFIASDTLAPTVDPEKKAEELLRLAKMLIRQDKIPGALNYLREMAKKYPETRASKEGAVLLAKLDTAAPKK